MEPFPETVGAYLEERGVRHGMLGVLRGEDRVIGTIMLANRYGLSRGFTGSDRALFETLAANASAALQYDRLEQAVSELRDLQDQLQHQAHHDPLTGLANRALFSQRVREALEGDAEGKVAVMFIDLDDFKGVNDTLGHAIGDQLLRGVASRLVRSVRRDDVVARLGGDEFAVLVRRDEDAERGAVEIAERTLQSFLMPVAAGEKPLNVSLSIGIAASHSARTHAEELLRDADVAMYEAKEGGKRRFAVFTPEMRDSIVRRHDLKDELERAIEVPRADRPVPADRRPGDRRDGRGRGARALEPSGPRPHPPGRVHPARRGHRPDRPARALRARGGVRAGRRAPPRSAASRSTCPRSSSSTPT